MLLLLSCFKPFTVILIVRKHSVAIIHKNFTGYQHFVVTTFAPNLNPIIVIVKEMTISIFAG